MADKLLHLEIVTPGKINYSDDIQSFTAPGTEGSFQILPRHASFITSLQVGKVKFITKDGSEKLYATSGGVVEVHENKISMLAETIEAKEDIDVQRALEAKRRAEESVKTEHGTELEAAKVALLRASNRLQVAGYDEQ
jgi:F-type H+-transporting ATPase subunit epsilon